MGALIQVRKKYITVRELAKLWKIPLEDIRYLGEEEELEICIRKLPLKVAIQDFLSKPPYNTTQKQTKDVIKIVEDPQPLHPTDIYLLFANKESKIRLSRLKTNPIMKINKIQSEELVEVGFDDMIITESEIRRFEFERGFNSKTNEEISKELFILKSSDFSNFELHGNEYNFGNMQALVIRELYDKYYAGDPWVHGKILLRKAGSESFRLGNLFKGHSNWKKVIISNGKGYYRINLPYTEPIPIKQPTNDSLF